MSSAALVLAFLLGAAYAEIFETADDARLAAEKELESLGGVLVGTDEDPAMQQAEREAVDLARQTIMAHPESDVEGIKVDLGVTNEAAPLEVVMETEEGFQEDVTGETMWHGSQGTSEDVPSVKRKSAKIHLGPVRPVAPQAQPGPVPSLAAMAAGMMPDGGGLRSPDAPNPGEGSSSQQAMMQRLRSSFQAAGGWPGSGGQANPMMAMQGQLPGGFGQQFGGNPMGQIPRMGPAMGQGMGQQTLAQQGMGQQAMGQGQRQGMPQMLSSLQQMFQGMNGQQLPGTSGSTNGMQAPQPMQQQMPSMNGFGGSLPGMNGVQIPQGMVNMMQQMRQGQMPQMPQMMPQLPGLPGADGQGFQSQPQFGGLPLFGQGQGQGQMPQQEGDQQQMQQQLGQFNPAQPGQMLPGTDQTSAFPAMISDDQIPQHDDPVYDDRVTGLLEDGLMSNGDDAALLEEASSAPPIENPRITHIRHRPTATIPAADAEEE